jgi:hypothetical protein
VIEASVWFSAWILHAFLGLDRLVQAVRPAAARHQAAGEFVDDDHLAVLHHVMLVLVEQVWARSAAYRWCTSVMLAGSYRLRPSGSRPSFAQQMLGVLVAVLGEVTWCASRRP